MSQTLRGIFPVIQTPLDADGELDEVSLRREVAFYLLAGAHTSATAFTRVTHNILEWVSAHPEDRERARTDPMFVQQCTHETVRLQPSSPVAMRWALADIDLGSGTHISQGARVVIDLSSVNRDAAVFGGDADEFRPGRELPEGVAPYGLSFGLGMHACIGQDLAAGLVLHEGESLEGHLFGLVPQAVQYLFDHGCVGDPDDPPEMDPSTTRPYFGRYPVLFPGTPGSGARSPQDRATWCCSGPVRRWCGARPTSRSCCWQSRPPAP